MHKKVAEIYGHQPAYNGFVVGCEFEIEQVNNYGNYHAKFPEVHVTSDHSLRDNGMEFITPPCLPEVALKAHEGLGKHLSFVSKEKAFSFRTSTHVHVNFLDVTEEKVKQFIYLYSVLEPYFFAFASKDRQNNIFCVPLFCTTQSRNYGKPLTELVKDGSSGEGVFRHHQWHKYAAFNILPLATQGTIEFRHLEGTFDTAKVKAWLDLIEAVYDFNLIHKIDFTSISVLDFIKANLKVFGLTYDPQHDSLMESVAIDIVLALTKPDVNKILDAVSLKGEI